MGEQQYRDCPEQGLSSSLFHAVFLSGFVLLPDLGNMSEIVNSLSSNGTVNQQARSLAWKQISNRGTMPRQKTREELLDRIDELEAENETLQDQVDSIADIIEGEEEEDDEGED
jgi:hypothetical protein